MGPFSCCLQARPDILPFRGTARAWAAFADWLSCPHSERSGGGRQARACCAALLASTALARIISICTYLFSWAKGTQYQVVCKCLPSPSQRAGIPAPLVARRGCSMLEVFARP